MKKTPGACEPAQNLSVSLGLADGRDLSKTTIHRIIVTPVLRSNGKQRAIRSGAVYTASYLGEVIVMGSTQPALDAARILHARGLTGLLEMWDEVSPHYRFRIGITNAAKLTIEEGDRRPRFVQFKSFDGRDTVEAFSARPGINMAPKPNGPFTTLRPAVAVQG
jgi:hypothetical protein